MSSIEVKRSTSYVMVAILLTLWQRCLIKKQSFSDKRNGLPSYPATKLLPKFAIEVILSKFLYKSKRFPKDKIEDHKKLLSENKYCFIIYLLLTY